MKWMLLAAYVSLALPVLAEGDDDLGLPQLDVPIADPVGPTGYFTHDGKVYALVAGRAVPLDQEVTMRITPRNFIGPNRLPMRLPAGHLMMADGTLQSIPASAQLATPVITPPVNPSAPANAVVPAVPAAPLVGPSTFPPAQSPTVATPVAVAPLATAPGDLAPVAASTSTTVTVTPAAGPGAQITEQSPTSRATVAPPQPAFASPSRPDRTGPLPDGQRPMDRTRPDSAPVNTDPTRLRDEQRPADITRPGNSYVPVGDPTKPGTDDYRFRDRTMPGPDGQRPPDPTRRRDR